MYVLLITLFYIISLVVVVFDSGRQRVHVRMCCRLSCIITSSKAWDCRWPLDTLLLVVRNDLHSIGFVSAIIHTRFVTQTDTFFEHDNFITVLFSNIYPRGVGIGWKSVTAEKVPEVWFNGEEDFRVNALESCVPTFNNFRPWVKSESRAFESGCQICRQKHWRIGKFLTCSQKRELVTPVFL